MLLLTLLLLTAVNVNLSFGDNKKLMIAIKEVICGPARIEK